jgi:hypothetical protein
MTIACMHLDSALLIATFAAQIATQITAAAILLAIIFIVANFIIFITRMVDVHNARNAKKDDNLNEIFITG